MRGFTEPMTCSASPNHWPKCRDVAGTSVYTRIRAATFAAGAEADIHADRVKTVLCMRPVTIISIMTVRQGKHEGG